jgi:hypothetical protein
MRRITFIALALPLIAVACSGNGETETFSSDPQEELVDAITASNMPNPDRRLDEQTAACVFQGIVDEFGVDGLAELGVTADNPDLEGGRVFATPDAGRRVVDAAMACIDVSAAIVSFLPKGVELLDDTVQCVADQLQTDTFRDLFADLVASGAPPEDILTSAGAQLPIASLLLRCVSPEEILELGDLLP